MWRGVVGNVGFERDLNSAILSWTIENTIIVIRYLYFLFIFLFLTHDSHTNSPDTNRYLKNSVRKLWSDRNPFNCIMLIWEAGYQNRILTAVVLGCAYHSRMADWIVFHAVCHPSSFVILYSRPRSIPPMTLPLFFRRRRRKSAFVLAPSSWC